MSPLYVAIDTHDLVHAKALAGRVRHHVGGIKLGLEFFVAHGRTGVQEMAALGLPIFLDLKLHDIPNTVASAIQALGDLSPRCSPSMPPAAARCSRMRRRRRIPPPRWSR